MASGGDTVFIGKMRLHLLQILFWEPKAGQGVSSLHFCLANFLFAQHYQGLQK